MHLASLRRWVRCIRHPCGGVSAPFVIAPANGGARRDPTGSDGAFWSLARWGVFSDPGSRRLWQQLPVRDRFPSCRRSLFVASKESPTKVVLNPEQKFHRVSMMTQNAVTEGASMASVFICGHPVDLPSPVMKSGPRRQGNIEPSLMSSSSGAPVRPRSSTALAMELFEQHQGTHILQSLDGFAFALASDGRFLYISETVSIYLGLSQVEMTGSSVFDYIHAADQAELAEHLGISLGGSGGGSGGSGGGSGGGGSGGESGGNPPPTLASPSGGSGSDDATSVTSAASSPAPQPEGGGMSVGSGKGLERIICIRMKSTLTKRGCHFKSSGYRVVLMICRLRPQYSFASSGSRKSPPPVLGLVGVAIALPPPSMHEVRLETDMFVTKVSNDFKIIHCEPRVTELLEYAPEELVGYNLYSICHAEDMNQLRRFHLNLMHKGQVMSPTYRVLNRRGGYSWVQTCATVINNSKGTDDQCITCINYVIGRGREYESLVMDVGQLPGPRPIILPKEPPPRPESDTKVDRGPDSAGSSNTRGLIAERSAISPLSPCDEDRPRNPVQAHCVSEDLRTRMDAENRKRSRQSEDGSGREESQEAKKLRGMTCDDPHCSPASTPTSSETEPHTRGSSWQDSEPGGPVDFSASDKDPARSPNSSGSSAIQWVGAPPNPATTLPATSLLRQLYASRESVIRSNIHVSRSGGLYLQDIPGTLPTPPGSADNGSDHQHQQHQLALAAAAAAAAASVPFTSPYVSVASYEHMHASHHNPSMTPPSSVSPRDKNPGECLDPGGYPVGAGPDQVLPIKPQAFVPGAGVDPGQFSPDAPQIYSHGTPGFHVFHSLSNKSVLNYPESMKNGGSWYNPPS
ncbi:unnamed protein product [Darwinula stevensoni]|uniref:PAS domain-containing protein n=1 Tax=Darwinula stevensoni TaxID=69355 RepID=A0A7R9FRX3_9CRUS|nr:unnamed protein product [Darwinula stevensoni]CAG0902110.1 unnamed protein product [Darwinula stevensoni]